MNRKQNTDPQEHYRMNYYPAGMTPAGYAVAAADKPGLYATSPYAGISYATAAGQPGLPPGTMQQYAAAAAVQQQYAMVSQASPYSQHAAAYYATPSGGFATTVPLSSLQTIPSSSPQAAYLSSYPVGVQRAMLGPSSVSAAGYGGSPLYATSSYAAGGIPGVPGHQPGSRPQFGVAPVGFTTAAATNLPPSVSSPATYPGATGYGPPY
eukprot:TRINITY_DN49904_c1_g2_i1.p1 TRINITY_DN49904_c1_g2~~TRINITY_DN49904_c1_g2_i1.p1  ORF type:complete len:209 (-),score=22.74 TRINITY_DN49904_c1_g2_i1:76-702(-)